MLRFQTAVATRCLGQSLRAAILEAGSLGAIGVQFDARYEVQPKDFQATARRDLLHMLKELGLKVASVTFPLRNALADPVELDLRLSRLRDAITFTHQLGSQVLTVRPGPLPAIDSPAYSTLVAILEDLVRHGTREGVILCLQPLKETADELLQLVKNLNAGMVAIDFDPAHFAMNGESPTTALRELHAQVGHFQLRDGKQEGGHRGIESAVGWGSVDWAEILALLEEMDYRGWLTAIRNEGSDRPADIARAVTLVQRAITGHSLR